MQNVFWFVLWNEEEGNVEELVDKLESKFLTLEDKS